MFAAKQNNTSSKGDGSGRLMDHVYDGIQEYDNPMPRWWIWMFWGSFWFSLAYLFHYWAGNGVSELESFEAEVAEVAAVEARKAMSDEVTEAGLTTLVADGKSVSGGGEVFQTRCAACHMEKGQGSIGPNLTDNSWIHGKGALMDIYKVVGEGVAAKGMPAWNRQLTPTELRQVVAFVGTLRGTNVEGKAPEGEPVQ